MSDLKIYLFGPPRIEHNGENIEINRRKAAALLAYLVVNAQPFSRDALATLLWPEHDQSGARGGLRRELSRLKNMLEETVLDIDRETVAFRQQAAVWLDVSEFKAKLEAVHAHHPGQEMICESCADSLAHAVALYRDDFMAGFSLPDSPGYDDWQFFQGDELRRGLAEALERLLAWHAHQGQFEEAIGYGRRWVELDRLHEPAQRQLMQLYAWADQQAAALRQYQEYESLLKDELGVEPEDETLELYEAIKARRIEPLIANKPLETQVMHMHNLPADTSAFIGRKREISTLVELLLREQVRLVTIVGLGGMGKTRLSIAAARRILEDKGSPFANGVVYVSLAGVELPEAIPTSLAKELGLSLAGQVDPLTEVSNHLQDKQMLMVLDNFEQLVEGAHLLNQLLATCPGVKLLVTSREPLRLESEWRFDLDGLPFPLEPLPADGDQYEAVQLFLQAAQQVQPDFQLTADTRHYVYQLCRLVSGIPLAIKLAATWLRVMPCQQIVAELERGFDILTSRYRDLPERQRSMRVVFDSTWNLLQPQEQRAFAMLSVFRGGFSEEAAFTVADVSPFQLVGLVDRGLVQFAGQRRYEIHELTRQFGTDKCEYAGLQSAVASQHSAYFFNWMASQHDSLQGEDPLKTLNAMKSEMDNLRQAWRWAVEHTPASIPMETAEAYASYYEFSGFLSEGERAFQAGMERLTAQPQDAETSNLLAYLCSIYIKFRLYQGKWDDFEEKIAHAEQLVERCDNPSRSADINFYRGMKWQFMGESRRAMVEFQKAIPKYQEQEDKRWIALSLSYLGEALAHLNQPDDAMTCHQQAFEIGKELRDARMRAYSLSHMGVAYYFKDDYPQAISHWERALAYFRQMDEPRGLGRTLNNMGFLHNLLGDFQKALQYTEQAVAVLRQIGDRHNEANALDTLGEVHFSLGNYSRARECFQQAMDYNQELMGFVMEEAMFRTNMGLLDTLMGDYATAEEHLEQALSLIIKEGHPKEIAKTESALATLYQETGRSEQALSHLEYAIERLRQSDEHNDLAQLLLQKAGLLLTLHEFDAAEQLGREGLQIAQSNRNQPALNQAYILLAKLEKVRGRPGEASQQLRLLLEECTTEALCAAMHYTLWQVEADPEHARQAMALYQCLAASSPAVRYQERLQELQDALSVKVA